MNFGRSQNNTSFISLVLSREGTVSQQSCGGSCSRPERGASPRSATKARHGSSEFDGRSLVRYQFRTNATRPCVAFVRTELVVPDPHVKSWLANAGGEPMQQLGDLPNTARFSAVSIFRYYK